MLIKPTLKDINFFNTHFAGFHDGVIVNIILLSGAKPLTHYPWEAEQELPKNTEELLHSHFYSSISNPQLRMEILDNNYDWPNQPPKRTLKLIFSNVQDISPILLSLVNVPIFDLSCIISDSDIDLQWRHHDKGLSLRSMENGVRISLFKCSRLKIIESIFSK